MTGYKRSKKIKVMFMIDFLYGLSGGTENQLVKILKNLEKKPKVIRAGKSDKNGS